MFLNVVDVRGYYWLYLVNRRIDFGSGVGRFWNGGSNNLYNCVDIANGVVVWSVEVVFINILIIVVWVFILYVWIFNESSLVRVCMDRRDIVYIVGIY